MREAGTESRIRRLSMKYCNLSGNEAMKEMVDALHSNLQAPGHEHPLEFLDLQHNSLSKFTLSAIKVACAHPAVATGRQ